MQKHNISLLLDLLSRSAHVGHCVTQPTKTRQQAAAGLRCIMLKPKVPQWILWTPLCLCPCATLSPLPPLARILAQYWRLPEESRPVKTIWEETSFSWRRLRSQAKPQAVQGNPDPTQPPDMWREQRNIKKERRQQTDSLPKETRPERGRQRKQRAGLRFVEMIITLLLFDGVGNVKTFTDG